LESFSFIWIGKNDGLGKVPVIQIRQVRKYFKDVRAVDGVDLNIGEGEFLALLGPNGAGKTTLVEMVEGLQKQDSGEILIKGLPWKGNEVHLRSQLGISLQETRFIDKLRTREVLELFASFHRIDGARVGEVMDMVRLKDKSRAFTVNLSGGQRQRLAIGIALLNEPSILLLDEPTTGLDPSSRREIWDILMEFKRDKKTTMILTTHNMEEAAYLCDRIVIMDQGRIIAQGGLEDLLSHNRGIGIGGLTRRRMTLDDLFISLTGRRLVE